MADNQQPKPHDSNAPAPTGNFTYGSGVPPGGSNIVPLNSVTVKYEKIDGVWKVVTMFPSL